jgi:predicted outer membrane repeat protein
MKYLFNVLFAHCLFLPFSSGLDVITIFVSPNIADSSPLPANCSPYNITNDCNLRSAIEACGPYLIDPLRSCVVSLSLNDEIFLNSSLGELQVPTGMTGHLIIQGNNASLSPLTSASMRFLTVVASSSSLNLTISDVSFSRFSALTSSDDSNSGGVLFLTSLSSVTFTHLTFLNNSATFGGSISLDSCSNVVITSCHFAFNLAQDGGAIHFLSHNQHLLISHSVFQSNQASLSLISDSNRRQGGAVFFGSDNSNIQILSCLFESNLAMNGGAVAFDTNNHLVLVASCSFWNNHATFGGGLMLYNQNRLVTVQDTIFDSNTAMKFYGE